MQFLYIFILYIYIFIQFTYNLFHIQLLNENLNTGILMLLRDCYCFNYDIKKASINNGIYRLQDCYCFNYDIKKASLNNGIYRYKV